MSAGNEAGHVTGTAAAGGRRLGQLEIESLLPHRGHALFLGAATVEGPRGTAVVYWDAAHPHLAGHFPGLPIVPGVFFIEAIAQLGGVVLASAAAAVDEMSAKLGTLASVRRALMHTPVRAGEPVSFEVVVSRVGASELFLVQGTGIDSRRKKVATVEVVIAVIDRKTAEAEYAVGSKARVE